MYTAFPIYCMHVQATGKKPAWETGTRMALPRKAGNAQANTQAPAKKSAWNIAPDEDDAELLDDSELLTEEDLQRPAVPCMSFILFHLMAASRRVIPHPVGYTEKVLAVLVASTNQHLVSLSNGKSRKTLFCSVNLLQLRLPIMKEEAYSGHFCMHA